jgi:hypothetical protein
LYDFLLGLRDRGRDSPHGYLIPGCDGIWVWTGSRVSVSSSSFVVVVPADFS